MSFSKARIQRFNECENDVPPPGAYDPRFDSKVRGSVIEKTERFQDNKSVGSADCNLSACSKNSVATSFRTPQLPRKKKDETPKTGSKGKLRALTTDSFVQKISYDIEHQLADVQVECLNKDRTIRELEKYIEDMKEEVRKLEVKVEELHKKQNEVEEQHQRDIEAMAKLQQDVLNSHDEKHRAEIDQLRSQLLEASEEEQREIETRRVIEGNLRNRITDFSIRVTAMESELANKKHLNAEKVQALEAQIQELTVNLEKSTETYKHEMKLLEEEKSKLDSCINDLTDERDKLKLKLDKRQNVILELQAQLSALQCELDELKAAYEKLVEVSSKREDEITENHKREVERLRGDFEKEKEILRNEREYETSKREKIEIELQNMASSNSALTEEFNNIQRLYNDVNNRLYKAQQELDESDRKHNLVLQKHKEELANLIKYQNEDTFKIKQQLEDARLEYIQEIENLTMARDKEITEIEQATAKKIEEETKRITQQADKRVENAEAVTRETLAACRAECEDRVKRVIAESDAKINAMIRDAKTTVEEEMRLTAERYKSCLTRVEIERAALDEKLAQKDAEITRLSVTLEELKASAETQESFGQSLQMELDRAETELAEKKEELRALKDQIRAEAAEMVARRKRFEVVMAENQASVAALTTRLAQSNAEVERLQHELKRGEDCINEHRDLLNIMRSNSQMIHEQVSVLMEQLDIKKGLVDQLEVESINEVKSLKSIFEAKIDDLKQIAQNEVAKLKADCDKKSAQNIEMKNQLHEMGSHLADAQKMLLTLEEKYDAQEIQMSRVALINKKLSEQLEEREMALHDTNKMLKEETEKHKIALNEANSRIYELNDKLKWLEESLSDRVQNEVQLVESELHNWQAMVDELKAELKEERSRREAAEEEAKKLAQHNVLLVKDYDEISAKYAEVVGHQNHRQRIRHVSQLKDKITQLEQDLLGKNMVIDRQNKIIEKYKTEERRAHSKGKENLLGLTRSTHATPASSPHKSLTPLRNRND